MARRTKRLWTDEEKRTICFQTTAPGVSVAQVARRYAMNANLCPAVDCLSINERDDIQVVARPSVCG